MVELDLVRLTKDKAAGRIKSFAMTPYGPKVELYPADAALRDLAKVQGLYEKDNDQQKPSVTVNITAEEVASIAAALNKEV